LPGLESDTKIAVSSANVASSPFPVVETSDVKILYRVGDRMAHRREYCKRRTSTHPYTLEMSDSYEMKK
jgi:hypothetical protein